MRLLPLAFAVMAMFGAVAPASAASPLMGCDAFMAKLRAEARDLQVDFSHALIVSRAKSDSEVFDISTKAEVDGTLTCRHDGFARFETHVAQPASARASTTFERLSAASLRAALGWDVGKSRAQAQAMASDAKEFLAASRDRGDVYIAGKTEEHAPGGVSLGLIYTDVDRAFVIVGPQE
ncbi:MAG TPA: hypothetical protein VGL41_00435 [Roseiarcus sp.]|jgi:hypothetical protein